MYITFKYSLFSIPKMTLENVPFWGGVAISFHRLQRKPQQAAYRFGHYCIFTKVDLTKRGMVPLRRIIQSFLCIYSKQQFPASLRLASNCTSLDVKLLKYKDRFENSLHSGT